MKKNIVLRILTALSGLILAASGLLVVAEAIFHAPVTECARKLLFAHTPRTVLIALLAFAAMVIYIFASSALEWKHEQERLELIAKQKIAE